MTYQIWWEENLGAEPVADAATLADILDPTQAGFAMHGARAFAYFIAPEEDADAVLRIDLDHDRDRAAIRWLPDATHGIEPHADSQPVEPIEVWEAYQGIVTIPAKILTVSATMARRAAAEYVTTGQRPASLTWTAGTTA
ncbi:MAG: hypothetical protein HKP61_03490 [Dactylosporangium sp.]|nr:hypothetical protein [Dactylosporangium sp.]NNJ60017.1 hypothetical protein [Dactylosporangium sp.]